jgi:hypothetical protein
MSDITLRLVLGATEPRIEARIRYAFSAYAALYGMRVVQDADATVIVAYGGNVGPANIVLPASYQLRPAWSPAPAPEWVGGMPCFHLTRSGEPDLLAEVFEWLAAPHELASEELDDIGRVAPRNTLAGTHGLDRRIPWVNRWLACVHAKVRAVLPRLPIAPQSPFGVPRTFVASHDLDHLSGSRAVNARRVVKNMGVSLLARRDVRTPIQVGVAALDRALRGLPTADGVAELLRGEQDRGIRSTYTTVPLSGHPRDPGYSLDDEYVATTLRRIAEDGHEIAVHGSYQSLETAGGLEYEYRVLAAAGYLATGGRQHWLRHRGGELFAELVRAGAAWDATGGHPDDVGYRHGAAFPFLPYDFENERPFPLIEIPLVVMERALCNESPDPDQWCEAAVAVLHAAGQEGWGGVSVLWHDAAFTATAAYPARLADVYWNLLDAGDRWVTANEMAAAARDRWQTAGAINADRIPLER